MSSDEATPGRGLAVHDVLIRQLMTSLEALTSEVRGLRDDIQRAELDRVELKGRVGALEVRPRLDHAHKAAPQAPEVPRWVWHSLVAAASSLITAVATYLAGHH